MEMHESFIKQEAQRGYEAYSKSTNNKNFRGEEMPAWSELPLAIQKAWQAAAFTIAQDTLISEESIKANNEEV